MATPTGDGKPRHLVTPPGLELRDSGVGDGTKGVFCLNPIPEGQMYGPYAGEVILEGHDSKVDYRYAWEVYDTKSNELMHIINATKPETGNWMRYVNCARYFEEQNIVSVQVGSEIFYKAIRPIPANEELMTWFSLSYQMQKKSRKKRKSVDGPEAKETVPIPTKKKKKISTSESPPVSEDMKTPILYEMMTTDSKYGKNRTPSADEKKKTKLPKSKSTGSIDITMLKGASKLPGTPTKKPQTANNTPIKNLVSISPSSGSATGSKKSNPGTPKKALKVKDLIALQAAKSGSTAKSDSPLTNKLPIPKLKSSSSDSPKVKGQAESTMAGMVLHSEHEAGKIYQFELRQEHHAEDKDGKKMFTCDICFAPYSHAFSLKRHFLRSHINAKYLPLSDITNCLINVVQQETSVRNCESNAERLMREKKDVKKQADAPKEQDGVGSESGDKKGLKLSGVFRCYLCSELFDDLDEMKKHTQDHPAREKITKKFSCDKCDMKFAHKNNLARHQDVHSESKPAMCPVCEKSFNKESNMKKHLQFHLNKNFTCTACAEKFTTVAELRKHVRMEHPASELKKATKLKELGSEKDKGTKSVDSIKPNKAAAVKKVKVKKKLLPLGVKNSELTVNTKTGAGQSTDDDKPVPCPICNKRFSSVPSMKKHAQFHGNRRFSCRYCKEKFPHPFGLRKHLWSLHMAQMKQNMNRNTGVARKIPTFKQKLEITEVKQEGAGTTGDTTGARSQVSKLVNLQTSVTPSSKVSADKPFSCRVCGKAFPSEANMKMHLQYHFGRTFSCRFCFKKFPHPASLRKHLNSEHPEGMVNGVLIKNKPDIIIGPDGKRVKRKRKKKLKAEMEQMLGVAASDVKKEIEEKSIKTEDVEETKSPGSPEREEEEELIRESEEEEDLWEEEIRITKELKKKTRLHFSCILCKKRFNSYVNMCRHKRLAHRVKKYGMPTLSRQRIAAKMQDCVVVNDYLPITPAEFYANVAENIATNLDQFIDGKQEALTHYEKHVRIPDYQSVFNVSPEEMEDIQWSRYNFPRSYTPWDGIASYDIEEDLLNVYEQIGFRDERAARRRLRRSRSSSDASFDKDILDESSNQETARTPIKTELKTHTEETCPSERELDLVKKEIKLDEEIDDPNDAKPSAANCGTFSGGSKVPVDEASKQDDDSKSVKCETVETESAEKDDAKILKTGNDCTQVPYSNDSDVKNEIRENADKVSSVCESASDLQEKTDQVIGDVEARDSGLKTDREVHDCLTFIVDQCELQNSKTKPEIETANVMTEVAMENSLKSPELISERTNNNLEPQCEVKKPSSDNLNENVQESISKESVCEESQGNDTKTQIPNELNLSQKSEIEVDSSGDKETENIEATDEDCSTENVSIISSSCTVLAGDTGPDCAEENILDCETVNNPQVKTMVDLKDNKDENVAQNGLVSHSCANENTNGEADNNLVPETEKCADNSVKSDTVDNEISMVQVDQIKPNESLIIHTNDDIPVQVSNVDMAETKKKDTISTDCPENGNIVQQKCKKDCIQSSQNTSCSCSKVLDITSGQDLKCQANLVKNTLCMSEKDGHKKVTGDSAMCDRVKSLQDLASNSLADKSCSSKSDLDTWIQDVVLADVVNRVMEKCKPSDPAMEAEESSTGGSECPEKVEFFSHLGVTQYTNISEKESHVDSDIKKVVESILCEVASNNITSDMKQMLEGNNNVCTFETLKDPNHEPESSEEIVSSILSDIVSAVCSSDEEGKFPVTDSPNCEPGLKETYDHVLKSPTCMLKHLQLKRWNAKALEELCVNISDEDGTKEEDIPPQGKVIRCKPLIQLSPVPSNNFKAIAFGCNGQVNHVCGVCKKHFLDSDALLRHHMKKHPSIDFSFIEVESGNDIDLLFYTWPCNYGLLASSQPFPEDCRNLDVFTCTRCGSTFKHIHRLHVHIINCDPKNYETLAAKRRKYRKKMRKQMMEAIKAKRTEQQQGKAQPANPPRKPGRPKGVFGTRKKKTESSMNSPTKNRKRRNYELLYNPHNHVRRREMTDVLETHQCRGCENTFKTLSLLERHAKKCSGKEKLQKMKPVQNTLIEEMAQKPRHTCRYCSKHFTYLKSLANHYRAFCSVRKSRQQKGLLGAEDFRDEEDLLKLIKRLELAKLENKEAELEDNDGRRKKGGWPRGVKRKNRRKRHCWTYVKKKKPDEKDGVDGNFFDPMLWNPEVDWMEQLLLPGHGDEEDSEEEEEEEEVEEEVPKKEIIKPVKEETKVVKEDNKASQEVSDHPEETASKKEVKKKDMKKKGTTKAETVTSEVAESPNEKSAKTSKKEESVEDVGLKEMKTILKKKNKKTESDTKSEPSTPSKTTSPAKQSKKSKVVVENSVELGVTERGTLRLAESEGVCSLSLSEGSETPNPSPEKKKRKYVRKVPLEEVLQKKKQNRMLKKAAEKAAAASLDESSAEGKGKSKKKSGTDAVTSKKLSSTENTKKPIIEIVKPALAVKTANFEQTSKHKSLLDTGTVTLITVFPNSHKVVGNLPGSMSAPTGVAKTQSPKKNSKNDVISKEIASSPKKTVKKKIEIQQNDFQESPNRLGTNVTKSPRKIKKTAKAEELSVADKAKSKNNPSPKKKGSGSVQNTSEAFVGNSTEPNMKLPSPKKKKSENSATAKEESSPKQNKPAKKTPVKYNADPKKVTSVSPKSKKESDAKHSPVKSDTNLLCFEKLTETSSSPESHKTSPAGKCAVKKRKKNDSVAALLCDEEPDIFYDSDDGTDVVPKKKKKAQLKCVVPTPVLDGNGQEFGQESDISR